MRKGVLYAVAAMGVLAGAPAAAQGVVTSGWVAPPGTVRAGVRLDFAQFDSRFAGSGTEPLGADLAGPLHAGTFAPLGGLRTEIERLFASTGGGEVPQGAVALGELDPALSADVRWAAMELGLGLLPRLEVGVAVPIYRAEVQVNRLALSGGTLGLNPAPQANAAALAAIDPELEALGGSPVLPLAESALGAELLRRVEALGGELVLPDSAAGVDALQALLTEELGLPALEGRKSPWRLADVELVARARVLDNMGAAPFPTEPDGLHYRLTASAGVRLPTGAEGDTVRIYTPRPAVGLNGWSVGAEADVFAGSRAWVSGAARYAYAGPAEVIRRVADPEAPLASSDPPRAVRWSPGAELRLALSPRLRVDEALSVGAEYELVRVGGSTFTAEGADASLLDLPGGTYQRLGASLRFSTLPAYGTGARLLPAEFALSYRRDLSGPARAPAATALSVEGRLYHRLWGR